MGEIHLVFFHLEFSLPSFLQVNRSYCMIKDHLCMQSGFYNKFLLSQLLSSDYFMEAIILLLQLKLRQFCYLRNMQYVIAPKSILNQMSEFLMLLYKLLINLLTPKFFSPLIKLISTKWCIVSKCFFYSFTNNLIL